MTFPTGSTNPSGITTGLPIADQDGDLKTLSDVLGGSGALDSEESTEPDLREQLVNVGGIGENLGPLVDLHSFDFASPTSTQQELAIALGMSAVGANPGALSSVLGSALATYFTQRTAANKLSALYTQALTQQDPFDPNYTQVYTPVSVPSTAGMPAFPASASPALQSDLTASLTASGNVASYSQAVYVTQNRLFSAYQSEDLTSFDAQAKALATYIAALASNETAQGQADTALASDLSAAGGDATITAATVAAFQSSLKTGGSQRCRRKSSRSSRPTCPPPPINRR